VTRSPFTIDGTEIDPAAPRSQGMDDPTAQAISDAASTFRAQVMHLHCDVAGRDVTLTASNCPPGLVLFVFGDGTADVEQRVDDGATPEVTHTYGQDGVFQVSLHHDNGDRADLEVAVNWPPPPPDWSTP
jgi:hypothetical protein